MNDAQLKAKLAELKSQNGERKILWKPQPGTQIIRIVPYIHNKDWPFVELFFHYNIAKKKTLISPMSFGRPDPIQEFAEQLQSTGNTDEWKQGKKLESTRRTYVPILVRGEEDQGVKFWGFGTQIYEQLLSKMDNPKWGDITHPTEGRDIEITFEKAKSAKDFPKTTVDVDPDRTPITTNRDVLEKMRNMPEVASLWQEPSYADLRAILEEYIKAGMQPVDIGGSNDSPDDDVESAAPAPQQPPTQSSFGQKAAATANVSADDTLAAFQSYFKK